MILKGSELQIGALRIRFVFGRPGAFELPGESQVRDRTYYGEGLSPREFRTALYQALAAEIRGVEEVLS